MAREKPRMQNISKNNGIVFIFLVKQKPDILYDILCVCVLKFFISSSSLMHHHTLLLFIVGT